MVMKKFVVSQIKQTNSIKFGNYDKLNENGLIPENSLVEIWILFLVR